MSQVRLERFNNSPVPLPLSVSTPPGYSLLILEDVTRSVLQLCSEVV